MTPKRGFKPLSFGPPAKLRDKCSTERGMTLRNWACPPPQSGRFPGAVTSGSLSPLGNPSFSGFHRVRTINILLVPPVPSEYRRCARSLFSCFGRPVTKDVRVYTPPPLIVERQGRRPFLSPHKTSPRKLCPRSPLSCTFFFDPFPVTERSF